MCQIPGRLEVITRLANITSTDVGGKSAQSHENDSKLDQWHLYSMFACACPPEDSSDGGFRSVKDLCRLVFPYLKSGNDLQIVSPSFLIHGSVTMRTLKEVILFFKCSNVDVSICCLPLLEISFGILGYC